MALLIPIHVTNYAHWKAVEDWSSSYWDIRSDMPIFAVSSNKLQLLPSQSLGLLDWMSPKLYTMWRNSFYLIFWNQNCDIAICFRMAVPQRRLADFSTLIGCPGNVPWPMAKYSTVKSSACKSLSCGEKIVKIGPVYPEIFDEIRWTTTSTRNAISISQFSAETTGLIFTKFLHNIVALVVLFNLADTRRYLIPFLNVRAISAGGRQFCPIFAQNRLPSQRPLRYRKKGVQIIIYTKKAFIWCKDCENRSSGSWDNLSPRNH